MSARPRKRGRRGGSQQENPQPSITKAELETKTVAELRAMAAEIELDVKALKKKDDIITAIFEAKVKAEGFVDIMGV
ncbi:MAG: Rho termination factor N-terminal domain-containing protein, partial [Actinomycetota bacterium]|nr:Rho termination factor N-terminal domain-containing protein [Actinomycetota bacterium]